MTVTYSRTQLIGKAAAAFKHEQLPSVAYALQSFISGNRATVDEGGWTTSSTANQVAIQRADAAVTAALIPICLAQQKVDVIKGKKLGELRAITTSYDQTDFVMKSGWATFPFGTIPSN